MAQPVFSFANRGMRKYTIRPAPPPPAPVPPPPPPGPTIPLSTMVGTGDGHNGPSQYAGLKLTAGSGPVRVYSGPNTSYPLVHEVLAPVLGEWNAADGVDFDIVTTWRIIQSAWTVLAGAGQTVQFAFGDYVRSPFPGTTKAAELARITAPYTAGTLWWKAKGAVSGDGSGSSEANAINGAAALKTKLAAGVADWMRVRFSFVNGACTIASDGADFPYTGTVSSRLSSGSAMSTSPTSPAGIYIGTNNIGTSTASRLWFDFGDGTQRAFDMSGATNTNRRQWAAVRIMGEEIVVTGLNVKPPNWLYICDPVSGATRIPGPYSNAEDASYENHGIMLFGNGNHLHNWRVEGDKVASGYGLVYSVAEEGVAGASGSLRGSLSYGHSSGCLTAMQAKPFGATGYDLEVPTGLDIFENLFDGAGWGHSVAFMDLSSGGGGNASGHGNCVGLQGKWFGACHFYRNVCTGNYQDGVAGVAQGVVVADNLIYDLNRTTNRSQWFWRTSGTSATGVAIPCWDVQTLTNNEGNAIKTGLSDKDLRSPTDWLGTDGDPMTDAIKGDVDHLGVAEARWVVVRNIINNVNASGITSNESNGGFVCANEIIEPRGTGLLILGQSKAANPLREREQNWYFANNIVRKTVTGASSWCFRFESTGGSTLNVSRIWFYNNIVHCGASQNDGFIGGGTTFIANKKNVFTKGTSFSGTYSQLENLTDAGSKAAALLYVASVGGDKTNAGLPVGNVLRTAGTPEPQTGARSHGRYLDFRGVPFHATTPCVGPCNAP